MNTTTTAKEALNTWVKSEELTAMDTEVLKAIYDSALALIISASEDGDYELEARSTHNLNSVARENLRRYLLNK